MKMYSFGGIAFDKDGIPSPIATGFVIAQNDDEAQGKAIFQMKDRFPKRQGHSLWFAETREVPNIAITSYATDNLDMVKTPDLFIRSVGSYDERFRSADWEDLVKEIKIILGDAKLSAHLTCKPIGVSEYMRPVGGLDGSV